MGVITCDRNNCDNVMAERYAPVYGDLCEECFKELVSLGVKTDIDAFMRSEKTEMFEHNASFHYFDRIFHDRWEEE